jgi:hypothetical protein
MKCYIRAALQAERIIKNYQFRKSRDTEDDVEYA